MFADGLKEQAEKLMIPGYYDENSSAARLMRGGNNRKAKAQPVPVKEIKTQLEQKKEILRLKKEI